MRGEAETAGERRAQNTSTQEVAHTGGEASTFPEHGIGRGTDPFSSMSEARAHQMVFGSQYIYIK